MGRTIAIIGASANPKKFGNKAVRAYKKKGYDVFPINPNETEIEGLKVYKKVTDIDGSIEFASFYVPPEIGIQVVPEVLEKRIMTVYLNPGAESEEIVQKLKSAGVQVLLTCSIVAIGMDPNALNE